MYLAGGFVMSVVLNLLIGIQAECDNQKSQPQWFMQFGVRDMTHKDLAIKDSISSQKHSDQSQKNVDLQPLPRLSYTVELRNSPLPLMLLGNQYYYFGEYFKANYFTATQFCRDHGMELLSIETKEENDNIINYLKKNQKSVDHLWTSGTDLGQEGHFVWLSTGKKLNYTHWSPPQPDNAGKIEHCLEIWKLADNNYIWNDIPCANQYHFMCEVRSSPGLCSC